MPGQEQTQSLQQEKQRIESKLQQCPRSCHNHHCCQTKQLRYHSQHLTPLQRNAKWQLLTDCIGSQVCQYICWAVGSFIISSQTQRSFGCRHFKTRLLKWQGEFLKRLHLLKARSIHLSPRHLRVLLSAKPPPTPLHVTTTRQLSQQQKGQKLTGSAWHAQKTCRRQQQELI